MANFNSLLSTTAFEAPKPKNFPSGFYLGNLKQPKMDSRKMQGKDEKEPKDKLIVSFPIVPTEWPEELGEAEKEGLSFQGKVFTKDFIFDVEKLEAGDKSELWGLDQFLRSIGVSGSGTYEELLPNATGASVQFQLALRKYNNKQGEEVEINDVKKVTGI